MIKLMILLCTLYCIWLLILLVAWRRIESLTSPDEHTLSVSVIIPVRNESDNILQLLKNLENQSYYPELFEVLVIDDHSDDGTLELVDNFSKDSALKLNLIKQSSDQSGKKAALNTGVIASKGEVILTIDGDCEVSPDWITAMVSPFENEAVNMAFGGVALKSANLFGRLQAIDFAALIGVGAASWKIGSPNMCNGANLAFRKQAFVEVGGYSGNIDYPSGDDEFLMRKFHQQSKSSVVFVKNKSALVTTKAQPDFKSFVQQRVRWAGKWKLHNDISTKLSAIGVFVFYLLWLGISVFHLMRAENIMLVSMLWGVKWLTDVVFVRNVMKHYQQPLRLFDSILLSLLYPFYAIGIGLRTISYSFEWKGRKY